MTAYNDFFYLSREDYYSLWYVKIHRVRDYLLKMHVLLLHSDGDSYLKYELDKIYLEEKTIEEYSILYPDAPFVFQDKGYLNGDLIASRPNISDDVCPRLTLDFDAVDKVKAIPSLQYRVNSYDHDHKNGRDIYGNVYYICETDGESFDINDIINGYGSF